ncbi:MAG: protein arginine kinase [Planctomycetia bacterium]|nr:protein arginine kinase [Planctomycetia bacterium]
MTIDDLIQQQHPWFQDDGPHTDIVVSTRIRLARNLANFPFVSRLSPDEKTQIEKKITDAVHQSPNGAAYTLFEMDDLEELDRNLLVESHLISRELAANTGPRSVLLAPGEQCSILLIEEDHLRIQVLRSGLDLDSAWDAINTLDDQLEQRLVYAWSERLGYLTACPTNVGTGMRVSVMLHLPSLIATKQFAKVYQSLQKISLAVRGLYGEGSQAFGDFYQISNQATLGVTEDSIIQQVRDVVRAVIGYEMRARQFLFSENGNAIRENVKNSLQTLRTAQQLSMEESMHCLSSLRLGISMGEVSDIPMNVVNQLLLQTQPAHLQWIYGGVISSLDADVLRAQYIQKFLKS